jgi:hypothetical protein
MHVLKIGSLYVTADGTLSTSQAEALRIDKRDQDGVLATDAPRFVRLRPHGSVPREQRDVPTAPAATTD